MLNNLTSLVGMFIPFPQRYPQKPTQCFSIPHPSAKGNKHQTKIFHMLIYEEKIQCQNQISDCFKKGNDLLQGSSLLLLHWKTNKCLEVDQLAHLKCVNHSCYEKTDFLKTWQLVCKGDTLLEVTGPVLIKLKSRINLHLNTKCHYSSHPLHLFLLLFYPLLSLKWKDSRWEYI